MIEKRESERLARQIELDKQKSPEERNRMGQFATPSPLARDVLLHAQKLFPKNTKVRFLDPALGSGAFYAALRRVFPEKTIAEARGFEIDPHYGDAAQAFWADQGLTITHGDFTHAQPNPNFNLIICNPPYVRHHHISGADKIRLNARTKESSGVNLSGLAGLYCHFLLEAHAWMAPGAIAGWLIPSEFMDVNYGAAVKKYLLDQVTLLEIHRFDPDDVQFADALVSSAVVWIQNTPPPANHRVRFSFGSSLETPDVIKDVSRDDLCQEGKWTRFPRQEVRPAATTATVSDLFRVSRGLATGDNKFFVLDEAQIKEHGLPQSALRAILPSPKNLPGDVVEADASGLPTTAKRLFLLDPQMDQVEIDKQYPKLAAYLEMGKDKNLHERYLCSSRRRWYDQEQRGPAPIVCTYMGRGNRPERPFRFIRNRSKATVANSYLALYPKPALQEKLDKNPLLLDSIWRQLNAISAEDLLSEGRVYGGGLYKLEPKELGKVPLVLDESI
jgi:adenine-specific DNA-methyltransferase